MKQIYVETSSLVNWLFDEARADDVIAKFNQAELIFTSRLSILECERAVIRATNEKRIKETDQKKLIGKLQNEINHWNIMEITSQVCNRAGEKFPVEPIRSLDAIHLATALECLLLYSDLEVLSFDNRILQNLAPLGF